MTKCNCGTRIVEGGFFVLPLAVSPTGVLLSGAFEVSSTPVADVAEEIVPRGAAGSEAPVLEEMGKASCGGKRALGAELPLDAV